jgi:hypothetical protein
LMQPTSINSIHPSMSMKNTKGLGRGAILLFGLFALLFYVGCPKPGGTTTDKVPVPEATIKPEFERNPPIAQAITVELLDQPDSNGANVILTADFDEETRRRIGGKYLAMSLVGDGRQVDPKELTFLRDDGFAGDEKADDGRFSVAIMEQDKAAIEDFFVKLAAMEQDQHNRTTFVNRMIVPNELAKGAFTSEPSKLGKLLKIKPGIFKLVPPPDPLFVDHSLMITDVTVVNDPTRTYNPCTNVGAPTGAWTFGELMRQLASPNPGAIATDAQAISFIEAWLATWNVAQTVNGENLPARSTASIRNHWLALSAANGAPPGTLKLQNAPFRLLAIVNRVDLRGASGYGFSSAGEGRFVFGLLDNACNARQMTVIFEYGINKSLCVDVQAYAQEWANLAAIPFGDPAFNPALQAITDQFTLCGTNPAKPNESSINQVRTNEIALASPWELREFNLSGPSLDLVTVKQEPAVVYNAKVLNPDVQRLADWVNLNSPAILANNFTVPDDIGGIPFLGGKSHTQFPPTGVPNPLPTPRPHHWDADPAAASPARITDNNTRQVFSLNTCSGCHGGETQTFFTHVSPVGFPGPAAISGFLTGAPGLPLDDPFNVPDAAGRPTYAAPDIRGFNDLWRRALDLQALISTPCKPTLIAVKAISVFPSRFSH